MEFEGQKAEDLLGKTITFLCDGVADLNWTQKEIEQVRKETVSLAPLTDTARQLDMSRGDMNRGENGPKLLALAEELSAQAVVPLTKMGERPGRRRSLYERWPSRRGRGQQADPVPTGAVSNAFLHCCYAHRYPHRRKMGLHKLHLVGRRGGLLFLRL